MAAKLGVSLSRVLKLRLGEPYAFAREAEKAATPKPNGRRRAVAASYG